MKKIFTLLFTTALLGTAFAQYGHKGKKDRHDEKEDCAYHDKHDYDKRGNGNKGWYVFTPRERDVEVAHINREFDYKINRIQQQYYGGWSQKKNQVRHLEEQRSREIQTVMFKFSDRRNKFGDFNQGRTERW